MVKDIYPGEGYSYPNFLANVNGVLYFSASDGINGNELWKSDGTDFGTVMIKDIRSDGNSSPSYFTDVNGTAYFFANDGINGSELWKSDGTEDGTVMVKDINPSGSGIQLQSADVLANINGTLYFGANDGINGTELWKSDDTSGAVMVKDLNPDGDSYPAGFTDVNGVLYFAARAPGPSYGEKTLWTSDGTAEGTDMVPNFLGYGLDLVEAVIQQCILKFVLGNLTFQHTLFWGIEKGVGQKNTYRSNYHESKQVAHDLENDQYA